MKRLFLCLITITLLSGCAKRDTNLPLADVARYSEIYKAVIEGHDYLVCEGIRSVSMIHSESCPLCEKKKHDNND